MITTRVTGNFHGSQNILATTNLNIYFPVYTTYERERYQNHVYTNNRGHEPENKLADIISNDVYLYRKPERLSLISSSSIYDTYTYLFSTLEKNVGNIKYMFTYNDVQHYLNIRLGYIADTQDNILLLLTTNDFFIFDKDKKLKKNCLRLYISTEFVKNEIYKNFYKRLEKDYISKFYEEDIEVVFTTSQKIEEKTFKHNFNLEFNNLTELETLLAEEPNNIMAWEEEEGTDIRVPYNYEIEQVVEEELPF